MKHQGNLVIRTQADADKYSGLTEVTGGLSINASAKLDALKSVGGGLHYSPTPQMTLEFASSATKWVACPVALSDMRSPRQGDDYHSKIKARGSCAPVWEVTRKGVRVELGARA